MTPNGFMQRVRKSFFPEVDLGDTDAETLELPLVSDYDDQAATVASPIPRDILKQCESYSISDISAAIEKDGLCHTLGTFHENMIEDPRLAELWKTAKEVLAVLCAYLKTHSYPEIVIEEEVDMTDQDDTA